MHRRGRIAVAGGRLPARARDSGKWRIEGRRPIPVCAVPVIGGAQDIVRSARELREVGHLIAAVGIILFVPVTIIPVVRALRAAEFGY